MGPVERYPNDKPDDVNDDKPHLAGLRCDDVANSIRKRPPIKRLFFQFTDGPDVTARSGSGLHGIYS